MIQLNYKIRLDNNNKCSKTIRKNSIFQLVLSLSTQLFNNLFNLKLNLSKPNNKISLISISNLLLPFNNNPSKTSLVGQVIRLLKLSNKSNNNNFNGPFKNNRKVKHKLQMTYQALVLPNLLYLKYRNQLRILYLYYLKQISQVLIIYKNKSSSHKHKISLIFE